MFSEFPGDDSFEMPEKQAERQALKDHPEVKAALEHIWEFFAKDEQDRISKAEYARVWGAAAFWLVQLAPMPWSQLCDVRMLACFLLIT